jgi:tRNA wybutosine-synthesizing protein 3
MITFERRKEDCLKKDDKSSIGLWDLAIQKLCEKINKNPNYYTLSSCSGRIVLIKNLDKKQAGMFVFRTHSLVKLAEIKKALGVAEKNKEDLMFKQETCILHVCCKTLESAELLLNKSRECGWKNSGIMSTSGRIVLELRSTEYLALPVMNAGKLLVSDDFLKILVIESNKRMKKTWDKIDRLEKSL